MAQVMTALNSVQPQNSFVQGYVVPRMIGDAVIIQNQPPAANWMILNLTQKNYITTANDAIGRPRNFSLSLERPFQNFGQSTNCGHLFSLVAYYF